MFKSKLTLFQFIDEAGQRSAPFVLDPNDFPKRTEGFNDEMLQTTLVLVLADCSVNDQGDTVMHAVSTFPVCSAASFRQFALDDVYHREFSDSFNVVRGV